MKRTNKILALLWSSRSWWRTGKPSVLQSMGSQRVGHDWAANWLPIMNTVLIWQTPWDVPWNSCWEPVGVLRRGRKQRKQTYFHVSSQSGKAHWAPALTRQWCKALDRHQISYCSFSYNQRDLLWSETNPDTETLSDFPKVAQRSGYSVPSVSDLGAPALKLRVLMSPPT